MKTRATLLPLGALMAAILPLQAQLYSYDASGRLTAALYDGQAVQYIYDNAGNLTNLGVFSDSDMDGIYDQWEIDFFGSIGAALPLVDWEKDTLVNLLEFAVGRDPKQPDAPGATVLSVASDMGQTFLEFTYQRSKLGALFLDYDVQVSYDMQTWLSGPDHVQQVGETTELDPETDELSFRVLSPIEDTRKIYVRLQVKRRN